MTVQTVIRRGDIRDARAWFDEPEPDLGATGSSSASNETVHLIASDPELYRTVFGDARRAPVKRFKYLVW